MWVEFVEPGDDAGLFIEFMPTAPLAAVDARWRRLNDVTVRREDWERYEKYRSGTASDIVTPTYIERVESTLPQPQSPHVSKMAKLVNNGDEFIDWDFWAGKMPRWSAYQAVRLLSALDPANTQVFSLSEMRRRGQRRNKRRAWRRWPLRIDD